MKAPLFEFPSYKYEIKDWEFKKKGLLKRINKSNFIRKKYQPFETDRQTDMNKSWVLYLQDLIRPELSEFCMEAEVNCGMTDAWCVRYQKGDRQDIHNHRGWGFSGVLYVEFDSEVHTPTTFLCPWQNPKTDSTFLGIPSIREGMIYIVPSYVHHFVPPNKTRKQRTVIAFDLLPQLPEHQSLNKNV